MPDTKIFVLAIVIALVIGMVGGYGYAVYSALKGSALVPFPVKANYPCYKYTGTIPEAYCDTYANLHFYFQGNEIMKKGWYITENSDDCKACEYLSNS